MSLFEATLKGQDAYPIIWPRHSTRGSCYSDTDAANHALEHRAHDRMILESIWATRPDLRFDAPWQPFSQDDLARNGDFRRSIPPLSAPATRGPVYDLALLSARPSSRVGRTLPQMHDPRS